MTFVEKYNTMNYQNKESQRKYRWDSFKLFQITNISIKQLTIPVPIKYHPA